MTDYRGFREIVGGSKSFEFDDMQLTLTGFFSGKYAIIDFNNMDEDMFDELNVGEKDYDDTMRILAGSKQYEFDEDDIAKLIVSDYYTGDKTVLDLSQVTEDMYENLKAEVLDDDFEEAVNMMGDYGNGMEL